MKDLVQGLYTHQAAWTELRQKEAEVRLLEEKVRELVTELEKGRTGLEAAVKVGRGVRKGIEGLEKGESFFSGWSISLWHRARVVVAHHLSGNLRPCPCHARPVQAGAQLTRGPPRRVHHLHGNRTTMGPGSFSRIGDANHH